MSTKRRLHREMRLKTGNKKAIKKNIMELMRLASLIDDYALATGWDNRAEKDKTSGISLLKSGTEYHGQSRVTLIVSAEALPLGGRL